DAAKEEAEKTSEAKDDAKKTELPPSSSSLSLSSGFGDQFLKISFDSSLVNIVKDYAYTNVSSLLDIPIQQETPQTQSSSVQKSQVLTVVDSYFDTKVGDVFQKELQKHMADLIHKYSMQHLLELTKKPTPTAE
nr:hypothetical protein [Tanacetum cinerariifolium]